MAICKSLCVANHPVPGGDFPGAELLDRAVFLAVQQCAIEPESAACRRIDQGARVGGTHLEEDPLVEFSDALAIEDALQGGDRVIYSSAFRGHWLSFLT